MPVVPGVIPTSYPYIIIALAAALLPRLAAGEAEQPLTLAEAESLALARDAGTVRLAEERAALRETAVAEGQLPDPQLLFGPLNLPTDTLDFDQEPMTQLVIGIRQEFPPGKSRTLRRQRLDTLAATRDGEIANRRREVVRDVRELWLERYFLERAKGLVDEELSWFEQLEGAVTAAYATGGRRQHDIIRVQLEKELLQERAITLTREAGALTGELERWLGLEARRPLPSGKPELAPLPDVHALLDALEGHPLLNADRIRVQAGELGESLARQRYKPAWGLDLRYGVRDGEDENGRDRPDFVTAMVTVSLPVFTNKRQDRRVAAAAAETRSLRQRETDRRRALSSALEAERVRWQKLEELVALYMGDVMPAARANVDATLQAYENDTAVFDELVAAEKTLLDTRLKALRLTVDRSMSGARLHYLAGETP